MHGHRFPRFCNRYSGHLSTIRGSTTVLPAHRNALGLPDAFAASGGQLAQQNQAVPPSPCAHLAANVRIGSSFSTLLIKVPGSSSDMSTIACVHMLLPDWSLAVRRARSTPRPSTPLGGLGSQTRKTPGEKAGSARSAGDAFAKKRRPAPQTPTHMNLRQAPTAWFFLAGNSLQDVPLPTAGSRRA